MGAAAPVAAAAQGPRQVEAAYEFTVAGFAGFRIDLKAQFGNASYVFESHTFKEGLLRALTPHYESHNRAWGSLTPHGARPAGGSLSVVVGNKPRVWLAHYAADGTLTESHDPEWRPTPQRAIREDQKRGSLDPLSGALLAAMKGDAACEQTMYSNDGRRRIDVVLRRIGTESAAKAGVSGAKGEVLISQAHSRRVAGEFDDAARDPESRRERPMKLWFARLDDTSLRYPAKLEAQAAFGIVRGRLLHFRERPLTEQERMAMLR